MKDYPNPDLAIEVDISAPEADRAGIYAAMGVAEFWRFDGRTLTIERLDENGRYQAAEAERFPAAPGRPGSSMAHRRGSLRLRGLDPTGPGMGRQGVARVMRRPWRRGDLKQSRTGPNSCQVIGS